MHRRRRRGGWVLAAFVTWAVLTVAGLGLGNFAYFVTGATGTTAGDVGQTPPTSKPSPTPEASPTPTATPTPTPTSTILAPPYRASVREGARKPAPKPTTHTPTRTPVNDEPEDVPEDTEDPAPSLSKAERYEAEVIRLTNAERSDAGCGELRADERLAEAAQAHSDDMAENGYFDHVSQDGATPWDRMRAAGYDAPAAENIAMYQRTPGEVVQDWMESEEHRANMLNCDFWAIGVGVTFTYQGHYWTQDFGYE